jgi:thiol-disulfide isomerase/thioredoxin
MQRRLSPTVIAVLFFVVFDSLVFYGTYVHRQSENQAVFLKATPVPAFEWKGFDGKAHNIKELAGHVVVLHFWASWCPPCRDEFPKLLKAASLDKDVMFLTVSSDDNREKPEQFIKMAADVNGIAAPSNVLYAFDPSRAITYDEFLTVRYPETIIIDARQRMRRKFPVPVDWGGEAIRAYLKELKAEK